MGKTEKLHAAAVAYGDAKAALDRDYGNVELDAWRDRLAAFQATNAALLVAAREFSDATRPARTGITEEPAAA